MTHFLFTLMLLFVAQCTLALSVLNDFQRLAEIPVADSENSRLLETTDLAHASRSSSIRSQHAPCESSHYLIDDCLAASLEYFGNNTDIQNFRTTSKRFNRIHEQFRMHQDARFSNIGLLFQNGSSQNKYRSIDQLLHSIPLIPNIYVGSSIESDIRALFDLHRRSGKYVLRGLAARRSHHTIRHEWNHPFISLLLWNDEDWGIESILLMCVFTGNVMKVAIFKQDIGINRSILVFHPAFFGPRELNELLRRKRIRFPHTGTHGSLWTIGHRCCSVYIQKQLFGKSPSVRRYMVMGIGASCISCLSCILYLANNHARITL